MIVASRRRKEPRVPPHWWLPLNPNSPCSARKRALTQKLGGRAKVKRMWSGSDVCYALVAGPIDDVPDDWYPRGMRPIKVVEDDSLDDGEG
jgi:hypothetical protein